MISVVKQAINYTTKKPKILFLIDGTGAMFTAFLWFVILKNFHEYFGMPQTILTYLAIIAVIFCIYSTTCFLFLKDNWTPYIRVISIANLVYCILTIGILIANHPILTVLGITYFLIEILVICGLVYIELKVATAINGYALYSKRLESGTFERARERKAHIS